MRKPEWLKVKIQGGPDKIEVEKLMNRLSLHTVCREAMCPNLMECFGKKTATFLILGRVCTRNCAFCNIEKGVVENPDPGEPARIADAVRQLDLKHVVITSVTRDDLADGGSGLFAETVGLVRSVKKDMVIEVLIPDFGGSEDSLKAVISARPDIINHNVETVPSLYATVRPQAVYSRSLDLLKSVKGIDGGIFTKSGIMLGLGETREEVIGVLEDLRECGCDFLTIGQYLAPSKKHLPVAEYIRPETFQEYGTVATTMGFKSVASSPFVRSSYNAADFFSSAKRS
jgi:lipoyl synthase